MSEPAPTLARDQSPSVEPMEEPPAAIVPVAAPAGDETNVDSWPEFRGPGRLGTAITEDLPDTWSDTQNLRWKTPLPGPGSSSPVVWGDRVYLTCYSGYGVTEESPGNIADLQRHLCGIDRNSGKLLWQADMLNTAPICGFQGFNALHGYATSTPAVDDSGIYVHYGAEGAAAYSHVGDLLWQKPLGTGIHNWGTATSPVLFEDLVIVHADIEGQGLVALRKSSGEQVWQVATGGQDSWSTPALAQVNGRRELIFHHSQGDPAARLQSVDPRSGSLLWECRVLKDYLAPSPLVVEGNCYVIAYDRAAAIRLGGSGDVTDSHLLWEARKGSETCTPVYHEGHLYWAHQESGIAYCLNAATGEVVYEHRLQPSPGRAYASGVLANGNIFYVSRENGTFVVEATPEFRQLAHNRFAADDSIFNGTPAVSRDQMFLRSNRYLYCVGKPP